MERLMLSACLLLAFLANTQAQQNENGDFIASKTPRDGFYDAELLEDNEPMAYEHVEERDVAWSKRIWRELDLSEKMNHHFQYEKAPFVQILLEEANRGNLSLYDGGFDDFRREISPGEVLDICSEVDTVEVYDPVLNIVMYEAVRNDFNPRDVQRIRIKEEWYFDRETSRLGVRILGIAPIINLKDDQGRVLGQTPLFWIYYPHAREVLAKHACFNPFNDAQQMSWEDMLELRYFASYITKESNVFDRNIKDYKDGIEALREGENIKEGIFNFEQDLWEY